MSACTQFVFWLGVRMQQFQQVNLRRKMEAVVADCKLFSLEKSVVTQAANHFLTNAALLHFVLYIRSGRAGKIKVARTIWNVKKHEKKILYYCA